MSKCNIQSHHVADGPYGMGRAITQCLTHNWDMGNTVNVWVQCPLGRIEEATDAAIEKIEKALTCR